MVTFSMMQQQNTCENATKMTSKMAASKQPILESRTFKNSPETFEAWRQNWIHFFKRSFECLSLFLFQVCSFSAMLLSFAERQLTRVSFLVQASCCRSMNSPRLAASRLVSLRASLLAFQLSKFDSIERHFSLFFSSINLSTKSWFFNGVSIFKPLKQKI